MTISRQAMACTFALVFPAALRRAVEAGNAALDEVDRLEEKLSAYRPESEICRVNRWAYGEALGVDADVFEVIETGARISAATAGAFDIAAGALSRIWGFYKGPDRSLTVAARNGAATVRDRSRTIPTEAEISAALARSGTQHLALDAGRRTVRYDQPGVEINLGGIGKGYAIDRAIERVRDEFAVTRVLMHAGRSSVRACGAPPGEPDWKVALGDPFRPGRAFAIVRLKDRALGTSGSAFQYFEAGGRRFGHVLDPRTGWPAEQVASATALAPTAAEADALSTAFFVMGVERTREYVREHPGIAAVLVTKKPEIVAFGLERGDIEIKVSGGQAEPPVPRLDSRERIYA